MVIFSDFFIFILGLLIGSFLNVVILRLPHGHTLLGRSACPQCHYQLKPYDLVPVLSFMYLKGACRNCGKAISWRYPLLELVVASLFLFVYIHIAPVNLAGYLAVLQAWIIVSVCVVTFVVDYEHYLILDVVTFGSTAVLILLLLGQAISEHALSWSLANPLLGGLLAVAVGFLLFYSLWFFSRGRLMGFGDVKFMVFAGFAVGWPSMIMLLLLAFWLGALVALPLLALGRHKLRSRIPFGTFLAVATLIALLYGHTLWHWYIGLLYIGV